MVCTQSGVFNQALANVETCIIKSDSVDPDYTAFTLESVRLASGVVVVVVVV